MIDENESRRLFEEKVFSARFGKSIRRNPESRIGATDFISVDCPTKAEFVRRDENGNYVDLSVSAMWFGWQLRESVLV